MQRTCITKFVDLISISECAKPLLYIYPCTVLCIIPTSKKKRQQHFPGVWVHCVQQKIRENVTGISQSQCTGSTTGRSARRCSALCGTQFCSRLSHGCCGIYTTAEIVVEFWALICFDPLLGIWDHPLSILTQGKGQLDSEWIYEVIVSPKMPTKNYQDFCPGSLFNVV